MTGRVGSRNMPQFFDDWKLVRLARLSPISYPVFHPHSSGAQDLGGVGVQRAQHGGQGGNESSD